MTATLRPFDWRDIPILHRYRTEGLCLDAALEFTRGPKLSAGVLLSYLRSATESFTWICANECDERPLMGQMTQTQDSAYARLSFLAPESALESPSLAELLEQLAKQAGKLGAFNLLAEIEENAIAFEPLRKAGFAIYARQRIWKLAESPEKSKTQLPWINLREQDIFGIQALYHNVVPGLVQQVEPLPSKHIRGLVCVHKGEIIGFVDLKFGPRGIWAHPFIHPDIEDVDTVLRALLPNIPNRRGRSVFLCVRTYQSWLEPALNALHAQQGPAQAVMVKRLAAQQRSPRIFALRHLERQREITTPISQSKQNGASIPDTTKP